MKKNRLVRRESALKIRSKNIIEWKNIENPYSPTNKELWAEFEDIRSGKIKLATKEVSILTDLINGH